MYTTVVPTKLYTGHWAQIKENSTYYEQVDTKNGCQSKGSSMGSLPQAIDTSNKCFELF
uniref:Uncharacterized protein n=1 Tax=Arundo donax TaxID=35708 RepID=A0A0A9DW07_ARUDO